MLRIALVGYGNIKTETSYPMALSLVHLYLKRAADSTQVLAELATTGCPLLNIEMQQLFTEKWWRYKLRY